ncbi:DUF397 domain-containing protein [Streptomyces barkulensis]|uniref:DUF397 domain-containing protein n=1 Tax=Streptomyces barkulensis TaxID=1257026 RepID=UPI000C6ED157|nr:DUF397 domain-containing protein [Streptomyces barkulensis]
MAAQHSGWFKSSYSGANGECVETLHTEVGMAVRDSKEPGGPCIRLSPTAWSAFLSTLRGGDERAA